MTISEDVRVTAPLSEGELRHALEDEHGSSTLMVRRLAHTIVVEQVRSDRWRALAVALSDAIQVHDHALPLVSDEIGEATNAIALEIESDRALEAELAAERARWAGMREALLYEQRHATAPQLIAYLLREMTLLERAKTLDEIAAMTRSNVSPKRKDGPLSPKRQHEE